MKKMPIILLTFIIIMTSCLPAFGIDKIEPIKTDPIIETPIIVVPMHPILFYTKAVYSTPLYRLYSTANEKHTYTTSSSEKSDLISAGWTDDGIVAHVSPVMLPGYIPLYRIELFGQIEMLTTTEPTGDSWWKVTGTLGYIQPSNFPGATLVHESVNTLLPGDSFWDTDYYYGDEYIFLGPIAAIPKVPEGYTATDTRFHMWKNSIKLQEITLTDIAANLTGGKKYTLTWTTQKSGGKVDLHYSTDNGSTWDVIVENLDNGGTAGVYKWTVPNATVSQMKVKAYWKPSSSGSSLAWDTSNTFSTTWDPSILVFTPIDPGKGLLNMTPAAPTNLTANAALVAPSITLYWTDNSSIETGYLIERRTEGGIYAQIGTTAKDIETYKDTTVANGVEYTYRVRAKGSILNSGYSNEASAKYTGLVVVIPDGFVIPEYPDPPDNVEAMFTDGSKTEVLISWDPPPGDYTGFKVERFSGMAMVELGTTTEDDHDYMDTELEGLTGEVSYRVRTFDGSLTSTPSDPAFISMDEVTEDGPDIFDGTQSSWAEPELIEAYEADLTYPGVMYDYGRPITREEFCVIVVKLYEKLTGLNVVPGEDPFEDTDNPDVLIAYKLGIVKGISETLFAPSSNITRQEMCVMIYRALGAARFDTSVDESAPFPFVDARSIASWAIREVKFCYQNGIMNGTSPTTIDPLLNTPREQAIILIYRTYDSFSSP